MSNHTLRNPYFDFLRGVAIIMVVGIHTCANHCGFDTLSLQANTIIRQLLNTGVPIFFAISGFFLSNKDLTTKEKKNSFWKHQIPKVYIPTLIWSVPWLLLGLLGRKSPLLMTVLWLSCGLSIFYYIAVSIQNYLLLPVCQKIINSFPLFGLCGSAALSAFSIGFITWIRVFKQIEIPLIVYAGFFFLWIFFFVLGIYLARTERSYNISYIFLFLLFSLTLEYFETRFIDKLGYGGGIKPSSFLYSAFVILLLFSKKIEKAWNSYNFYFSSLVVWIGKMSFAIYLTHSLFARFVLPRLSITHLWLTDWVIVFLLDLLFVYFLRKVIPICWYKFLGL